eukprot:CAMPEP_0176045468 /NCGR_PEP_ID=MMETSP0120_2-20121206/22570_1 /TAXON_ID=160619 /ORGANISM="Kryptoperidinium foliaceum, Strain CCMP 1326" /LENGTH=391 /DNA_ID=CAMNT_0017378873 /DNA_START=133 /DNA_END=1304 /DNA_ORIENTATION=-
MSRSSAKAPPFGMESGLLSSRAGSARNVAMIGGPSRAMFASTGSWQTRPPTVVADDRRQAAYVERREEQDQARLGRSKKLAVELVVPNLPLLFLGVVPNNAADLLLAARLDPHRTEGKHLKEVLRDLRPAHAHDDDPAVDAREAAPSPGHVRDVVGPRHGEVPAVGRDRDVPLDARLLAPVLFVRLQPARWQVLVGRPHEQCVGVDVHRVAEVALVMLQVANDTGLQQGVAEVDLGLPALRVLIHDSACAHAVDPIANKRAVIRAACLAIHLAGILLSVHRHEAGPRLEALERSGHELAVDVGKEDDDAVPESGGAVCALEAREKRRAEVVEKRGPCTQRRKERAAVAGRSPAAGRLPATVSQQGLQGRGLVALRRRRIQDRLDAVGVVIG